MSDDPQEWKPPASDAWSPPASDDPAGPPHPGAPAPPLPTRLAPVPPGQVQVVNPSGEAKNVPLPKSWLGRELITRPMMEGAQGMVEGAERMASPGLPSDPSYGFPHRVGGASQAFRGGLGFVAPTLGPAAFAESIPGTLLGWGAGEAFGKGSEAAANALNVDPNYSAAIGDVVGLSAGVGAGAATKAFAGSGRLNPTQTLQTLLLGLRPGTMKSNLRFNDDLTKALPEINEAIQNDPNAPPTLSLQAFRNYVKQAKDNVWGHFQAMLGPRAQAYRDTTPVADAMVAAIPKLWRKTRPTTVKSIEDKADLFRGPQSINDISDFLTTQNAENNAHFGRYPADQQAAARADPEVAPGLAIANSLKQILFDYLNETVPGESDLARKVRQTYGSLISVGDAADHRQVTADLENAKLAEESKLGRVWNAAKALATVKVNPIASAKLAIKAGEPSPLTIDGRINLAFKKGAIGPAQFTGAPDYPVPYLKGLPQVFRPDYRPPGAPPQGDTSYVRSAPAYPAPPTTRALPSPTIKTPPPADTNYIPGQEGKVADTSAVRSVPAERIPAPPTRRISQGPSRPVPSPGTAASSSSGDVLNLVPVKDPSTGEVHYYPRPKPLVLPEQAKGGRAKSDAHLRAIERRAYSRQAALRGLRG
jgi:hypothetical protein